MTPDPAQHVHRPGFGGYGAAPVDRPGPKGRLYSLFAVHTVNGRKRYEPMSDMAYRLDRARHVFQNHLLGPVLYGGPVCELRPIQASAKARYRNL